MKIVIDIKDDDYYDIIGDALIGEFTTRDVINAIKNGTPLPNGHGKIIDVADLLDSIGLDDTDENREDNVGEIVTLEDIDFITAIIEADKTESEDKE